MILAKFQCELGSRVPHPLRLAKGGGFGRPFRACQAKPQKSPTLAKTARMGTLRHRRLTDESASKKLQMAEGVIKMMERPIPKPLSERSKLVAAWRAEYRTKTPNPSTAVLTPNVVHQATVCPE